MADEKVKPSEISGEVGFFDRFAATASDFVARAPFFVACLVIVVIWGPSYWAFGSIDTWQLVINTLTTIITFLLVALLQNTASRDSRSTQKKLNAIADGLADVIEFIAVRWPSPDEGEELLLDASELREAVGLEHRTGSK